MNAANEVGSCQSSWVLFFLSQSFFFHFSKVLCRPLISHDLLILCGPVMGGTGTVPHCAILYSFVATMGKVSRAAAGGPPLRLSHNPSNE